MSRRRQLARGARKNCMSSVNLNITFEARNDFGANKHKLLIYLCILFAILLNPLAILMNVSPQKDTKPTDQRFFLGLTAIVDAGLVVAFLLYRNAKQRQRQSSPVIRISEKGIEFGDDLKNSIPWKQVATLSDRIERQNRATIVATLNVTLVDGRTIPIDLLSLDKKPEQVARFATEALRNVRGINLRQIKDFATAVTCPRCGQPTDSLKAIQSGVIIFLLFHVHYTLNSYVCCRNCVRKQFSIDSAINLLTCNIAWPILWLVAVILPQSGKLLFPGHDKKALEKVA